MSAAAKIEGLTAEETAFGLERFVSELLPSGENEMLRVLRLDPATSATISGIIDLYSKKLEKIQEAERSDREVVTSIGLQCSLDLIDFIDSMSWRVRRRPEPRMAALA